MATSTVRVSLDAGSDRRDVTCDVKTDIASSWSSSLCLSSSTKLVTMRMSNECEGCNVVDHPSNRRW